NQMSELAAPSNVPSLEEVRDKIEKRYATALGSADLARNSVQGRMLEVQQSTTQFAGSQRLEQIRASLQGGQIAGSTASPAIGGATGAGASTPAASRTPSASVQQEIQQRVQQAQQKPQAEQA
ncbi:MAG: PspA/IM30 family protein, partial [Sciscionella sp.]|nr:PspA/IM30 family protein [Sciscionella sp.]